MAEELENNEDVQEENLYQSSENDGSTMSTVDNALPVEAESPNDDIGPEEQPSEEDNGAQVDLSGIVDPLTKVSESQSKTAKQLEELTNALRQPSQQAEQPTAPEKIFDITKYSDEQLADMVADNPSKILGLMQAQSRQDAELTANALVESKLAELNQRTTAKETEDRIAKTYEEFGNKYDDFEQQWDDGILQAHMDKNPGMNAMNAYEALNRDKIIEAQVAEKLADAVAKDRINRTNKLSSRTIPAKSSTPGKGNRVPDELKNPKKYGGTTAVLAARMQARRDAMRGIH